MSLLTYEDARGGEQLAVHDLVAPVVFRDGLVVREVVADG